MPERNPEPLSEAELADQEAVELPDREALSLFDTSSLLGGSTLPAAPTDSGGTTPPPTDTAGTAPPTADPSTTAPEDPIGLADRFGGIQGKFIG